MSDRSPHARNLASLLLLELLLGLSLQGATPIRELSLRRIQEPGGQQERLPGPSGDSFLDVTSEVGLHFRHFTGGSGHYYLPEITGSGAGLLDFDGDGDLDLYLAQGTSLPPGSASGDPQPKDRLYRNELIPSGELRFVDYTDQSTINGDGYGMGVAVGDINNDGLPDLYVTTLGRNMLLQNNGNGAFRDITVESGVNDPRWSTSAAFFDLDQDGWLDLFVTNYVAFDVSQDIECFAPSSRRDFCGPDAYQPVPDRLFRNRGDGTFEDISERSGITRAFGAGLGVVTADFDGDGWSDIFVANDGDANQLWRNEQDGTFRDVALLAGVALNHSGIAEAGMGVDAGDFDGDGDEDLFLTHLMSESNTLYVNLGQGLFEDRTIQAGLHTNSLPYTAFGTGWFDFDNDGWLDLLSLNGAVRILETLASRGDEYPLAQPNQLFRNTGEGTFVDVSREAGQAFVQQEVSRGAAIGDVDNDGDLDILVANNRGPARLLLNQVGNRRSWLGLRLLGQGRDLLGSRVEVVAEGRTFWRRVGTDGSYCSANDPRLIIGLGDARQADIVRVFWLGGETEEWRDLKGGQYWTLRQGESEK